MEAKFTRKKRRRRGRPNSPARSEEAVSSILAPVLAGRMSTLNFIFRSASSCCGNLEYYCCRNYSFDTSWIPCTARRTSARMC
jgi:hypothetical protein